MTKTMTKTMTIDQDHARTSRNEISNKKLKMRPIKKSMIGFP